LAVLFLITLAAGAQTPAANPGAQTPGTTNPQPPVFPIDHFLCYQIALVPPFPPPGGTEILDQFNPKPLRFVLDVRDLLCNPVSKNQEPVPNREAHLTGYRMRQLPRRNVRVIINNQFGPQHLTVMAPLELLVPTAKIEEKPATTVPPPPPIPRADHYFCYAVEPAEPFQPRPVTLTDQFGASKGEVLRPALLCNPAVKLLQGKPTGELVNREAHLACYLLREMEFKRRRVMIWNQFEKARVLEAVRPMLLCVPSVKKIEPQK
jgi:hypothetical protein